MGQNSFPWLTARPIAHRGLHNRTAGVIENSYASFGEAIANNFSIECDVQLTKDGEAVVFHDFELGRLTGHSGLVVEKTAEELGKCALSEAKAGDHINTLATILDQVAGRAAIVVEIKSLFDGDLRLTRRVVELLSGRNQHVAIKSFDPRIVAALRVMAPERPRGIVAMANYNYPDYATIPAAEKHAMANLLHFKEMQPDFISWNVKDLPHCGPFLCRAALDLPVMTWTVRSPEDITRASAHADQMVFEGFVPA